MKKIFTLCLVAFLSVTQLNAQAPVITSFAPTAAKPGDAVTLTGTGFNTTAANNVVFCGATKATVTAATATSVTITVPTGATFDYITLVNTGNGLAAMSRIKFIPSFSPAKTNLTSTDFDPRVDLATGSSVYGMAVGDLDGDGKPDLVFLGTNVVSVLRNISTPGSISSSSFAAKVDFATGTTPVGIAVGDVDGDGKLDIAISNNASPMSILRNTSSIGSISFATKLDFTASASGAGRYIGMADLDGDGKLDIAVSKGFNIALLRNTSSIGNISFAIWVDIAVPNLLYSIYGLAIGDLTGSGKPDIVALTSLSGGAGGAIYRFINASTIGSFSFSRVSIGTVQNNTIGSAALVYPFLALGDVNDDGKQDIVYAQNNSVNFPLNSVRIYTYDSTQASKFVPTTGPANKAVDISSSIYGLVLGDLDGNGKPDIAATINVNGRNMGNVSLRNIYSSGTYTASNSFASKEIIDTTSQTSTLPIIGAIADLDGDGRADVILSKSYTGGSAIYRNAGAVCTPTTGTFTVSACGSYTWAAKGNTVYSASNNTDTIHLTNAGGCDSLVTLNLTIKTNYTVTASAGSNGSISNAGVTTVCSGNNSPSYTITVNSGYHIADVLVDGNSIGAVSTYTFNNVIANHTIAVSFTLSCTPSTSQSTQTACGSYIWNGITYTTSGDYTVHFTNSCGLDSAATLHLTINAATTSTQTASVCSNQLPYTWNGLLFTAAGTQTKTGLTNSKGCDSSATLTLSVATASTPTVSIAPNANNICSSENVSFTATATNEGTAPIYQWKKNGVNAGIGSSITFISGTINNNDSVWCVLTSNSACATTATAISNKVKVVLKANPSIGVSYLTKTVLCSIGATTTANNNNTLNGGIWTSSNTSVATITNNAAGASGLVTATGNGSAILTYTKSNTNGCTSTANVAITVALVTTPSITNAPASMCKGSTTTLTSNSASGVWSSLNNAANINAATGFLTAANVGTASIKYTITDANGCTGVASANIPVNASPAVPSISYAVGSINPQTGAAGGYCNNRTFTLVGTPTGGVWSSIGGMTINATTGAAATTSLGAASVTYTRTVNGCSNSRSITGNVVGCAAREVNAVDGRLSTVNGFTLYPNPAKSFINLNVETLVGAGSIVITDLYGKQIKTQTLSMGTNTIDISRLSKGMYFISTITSVGKNTKKLVVE